MRKIEGGYILQPRIIKENSVYKSPPYVREIWNYLLREANSKDANYGGHTIKRGQLFRDYKTIREDLAWYVGYRKEMYNENHTKRAMKILREDGRVTTARAPGGVLITICNYDYYQDPKNYERTKESTSEDPMVELSKYHGDPTNNKNDKNDKKDKKEVTPKNSVESIIENFEINKDMANVVFDWLEYKKERKETYKSDKSIKSFITKLRNLSGNDSAIAREIVEQSFANNYAGVFELKNKSNGKDRRDSETANREREIMQLARDAGMA